MSGNFYDGKNRRTYRFPNAAVNTAAVFGRFQGPAGLTGRVRGIEYVRTAATTVAAAEVTVDTNAGLTTPASLSIPVGSNNLGGATTAALLKAANDLPADTVVEVTSDGGATAGNADVIVTVDWF